MSTLFQPPVFAGLVENLKHRNKAEKEICTEKGSFQIESPNIF